MDSSSPAWQAALEMLQLWADDPALLDGDARARSLIAKIHREGARNHKSRARLPRREHDRALRESTELVRQAALAAPPALAAPCEDAVGKAGEARLCKPGRCYVCKAHFDRLHPFYHLLCPACAELNWQRRLQRADLSNRIAVVTGGRVKIGFELALKLLRDGAEVVVTTRFASDALGRYQSQPDYDAWSSRLRLRTLDLRFVAQVEAFAQELDRELPHLDILVNNAAQTIARPAAFYAHLLPENPLAPRTLPIAGERADADERAQEPALMEDLEDRELEVWEPQHFAQHFPPGELDCDGQQVDLRPVNSWALRLGDVPTREAGEAYLVNALAPFILCGKLRPALERSPFERRFVVCASAMEGQFARASKTAFHPHLNMAKAALNMLVRTAAGDLRARGIFLNAVDTGWITDEHPQPRASRRRRDGFVPPLDCIDGAARLYDPIARGLNETPEPWWGHFLKDYAPHPW